MVLRWTFSTSSSVVCDDTTVTWSRLFTAGHQVGQQSAAIYTSWILITLWKLSVLVCQALKGVGHSHQPSKLLFYSLYLNSVVRTTRIKIYFYITLRWCIGGPCEWPPSPCIHRCFRNIWIDFPVELPRTNLAGSLALQAWGKKACSLCLALSISVDIQFASREYLSVDTLAKERDWLWLGCHLVFSWNSRLG